MTQISIEKLVDFDFGKLSDRQQWLIFNLGWHVGDGTSQPQEKIVKPLLDAGLIRESEVVIPGFAGFPMKVKEYNVDITDHAAYCAWCSENVNIEDIENEKQAE